MRPGRRRFIRLLMVSMCLPLAGPACNGVANQACACTALFAIVQVTVVDPAGAPVAGLDPIITLRRTGERLAPAAQYAYGPGTYSVVTDNEIALIATAGDTVRFAVSDGARGASGDFVIGVSDRCRCHITRIAGPSTLVLH